MNLQLFSQSAFSFVVAGTLGLVLYYFITTKKDQNRKWQPVATVSKLYIYPIKSAKVQSISSMLCLEFGVENAKNGTADRSFVVVNENGDKVNRLQHPDLRSVQLSMPGPKKVKLTSPKCDEVEFDLPDIKTKAEIKARIIGVEAFAIDCGEKVNKWFENLLGMNSCKFLYHDKTKALFARQKLFGYDILSGYSKKSVRARFQNFSPLNLVSESSIDDLNTRLEEPISAQNFRPNVMITGCKPYSEDEWKYVKIGTTVLAFGKHCNRCPQTTINPETGVQSKAFEPIKTLRTYRGPANEAENVLYKGNPKIAVDLIPIQAGVINIGDTVFASS